MSVIFKSKEPNWCSTNCLRLVLGYSRALTFPQTMCNMFQDYNLVAKHHRITRESCETLHQGMKGILTEKTNASVQGVWGSLQFPL